MRIVVLAKEVPDTYGDRRLHPETGLADRAEGDRAFDEIGSRALEVALSYADAQPETEIVVLSMGPESAAASARKALAAGATSAAHIVDEKLRGADLSLTAEVLTAALSRIGFDLVIAGNQSTDGNGGVLPAMLAELLGVPHATALTRVSISADRVGGLRAADDGVATVSAPLPAVISITEALPDARVPSFKGILAAKNKPLETLSLADLGVDAGRTDVPRSIMIAVSGKPPRRAGVRIVDEGHAGERLADFLVESGLA